MSGMGNIAGAGGGWEKSPQGATRAAGGNIQESLIGWMVHVCPFCADLTDWCRQRHG
jgi:hypothetical protein